MMADGGAGGFSDGLTVSNDALQTRQRLEESSNSEMKRYRNGEIWDFEHEVTVASNRPPFRSDPLPVLARAVAGCSNHNSVGGCAFLQHLCLII
ncbi:hypothetical protein V6N12_001347 [Hibiscus sabdariffa]|uniref:Uncharacterized protein n=1 Tax=Hibiscus sabdariffa TaxID=183260 RepID=A0ABR2B1W1_9ROSI